MNCKKYYNEFVLPHIPSLAFHFKERRNDWSGYRQVCLDEYPCFDCYCQTFFCHKHVNSSCIVTDIEWKEMNQCVNITSSYLDFITRYF